MFVPVRIFPYMLAELHPAFALLCSVLFVSFFHFASLTFFLLCSISFSLQVDRLMELHFKYLEAVQQADKRIEGEKHVSISSFIPFSHPSLLPSQSVSEAF